MNLTGFSFHLIEITARYRLGISQSVTGRLLFVGLVREVDYGSPVAGCGWPSGRNENNRLGNPGPWVTEIDWRPQPQSTSWVGDHSGAANNAEVYVVSDDVDAVDVKLRFRSSVENSNGQLVGIYVDNVGLRDCNSAGGIPPSCATLGAG
jgi:hypothetical protein